MMTGLMNTLILGPLFPTVLHFEEIFLDLEAGFPLCYGLAKG